MEAYRHVYAFSSSSIGNIPEGDDLDASQICPSKSIEEVLAAAMNQGMSWTRLSQLLQKLYNSSIVREVFILPRPWKHSGW